MVDEVPGKWAKGNSGDDSGDDQSRQQALSQAVEQAVEQAAEQAAEQSKARAELLNLVQATMPFGRFKDRRLVYIPYEYLEWFSRKGFPSGTLGRQLAMLAQMHIDGSIDVVRELARRVDERGGSRR